MSDLRVFVTADVSHREIQPVLCSKDFMVRILDEGFEVRSSQKVSVKSILYSRL